MVITKYATTCPYLKTLNFIKFSCNFELKKKNETRTTPNAFYFITSLYFPAIQKFAVQLLKTGERTLPQESPDNFSSLCTLISFFASTRTTSMQSLLCKLSVITTLECAEQLCLELKVQSGISRLAKTSSDISSSTILDQYTFRLV